MTTPTTLRVRPDGTRTWEMFAARVDYHDGREFGFFYEHPSLVRMCGFEAVPVLLIEDHDADLWGWIDADDPERICMIEHHKIFPVQFPYGIQPEIDRDHGEVVPVRVEVREVSDPTEVQES